MGQAAGIDSKKERAHLSAFLLFVDFVDIIQKFMAVRSNRRCNPRPMGIIVELYASIHDDRRAF